MTELAALADEIEEALWKVGEADSPAAYQLAMQGVGRLVAGRSADILAALRAIRPEPAADAVEAAAIAIAGTFYDRWDKLDEEERESFRDSARAALSALPRPEADEGAVRKADEIFDDITRGGPTVDAVMREDWATVAEWMRQRAEDGLAVTRAALAAAQEGSK